MPLSCDTAPSRHRRARISAAAGAAALLLASTASAQVPAPPVAPEAPAEPSTAFDVGVGTEVPIMVGGQATLELPYRFILQGEIGVLPSAYVNAVDGALVSAGAYSASTSSLLRAGLKSSFVLRASAGFRPFAGHGFEIMGGYTLTSLGGSIGVREALAAAAGVTVPAEIPDSQIQLSSTLHSLHVSLGWRWVIADHFFVRTSIAYLQSVASSSHLTIPADLQALPAVSTRIAAVNQAVDSTMNDGLTKYVKLPVIGLSMGYRF